MSEVVADPMRPQSQSAQPAQANRNYFGSAFNGSSSSFRHPPAAQSSSAECADRSRANILLDFAPPLVTGTQNPENQRRKEIYRAWQARSNLRTPRRLFTDRDDPCPCNHTAIPEPVRPPRLAFQASQCSISSGITGCNGDQCYRRLSL
jgi:hypothetical protein